MKKRLSFLTVLAVLGVLVSCGNNNTNTNTNNNTQKTTQSQTEATTEPETEETEEVTEAETTEEVTETTTEAETTTTEEVTTTTEEVTTTTEEVTTTETVTTTEAVKEESEQGELVMSETSGGLEVEYNGCTLTFPSAWKDRVMAVGNGVYCTLCYEDKEGDGRLFELVSKTAEELMDGGKYDYIIGTDGEKYIVPIIDDGNSYDTSKSELRNDYFNLYNDLQNIIPNAKCSTSPEFRPIRTESYTSSTASDQIKFNGTWLKKDTDEDEEVKQFAIFDETNGKFGIRLEEDSITSGTYWINTIAETYAEKGLVFINGDIYKANYSDDGILTFERLTGQQDDISSLTFEYYSSNVTFSTDVCDDTEQ